MEGGSFGFQIGGTEVDVILAIMNKRGVERLLSNKFTLGADASVAAGPVGRTASAQTDAQMTAEILSWSRSRGIFAGVALEGATLRGDSDANLDLYSEPLDTRRIVSGPTPVPAAARPLVERLSRY
jgi:lipid-binding SYLF domain-containing protein